MTAVKQIDDEDEILTTEDLWEDGYRVGVRDAKTAILLLPKVPGSKGSLLVRMNDVEAALDNLLEGT